MKITVDLNRRRSLMRAHTATHLLHDQLQRFFPDTKQEGSWVGTDALRFDYRADRFLTTEEVDEIVATINACIIADYAVVVEEMSFDDAKKLGAKAFFADKYGDRVRVVRIDQTTSIELCGGTHVNHTGEIGAFLVTGQESVSAGVKRIHAVCGPAVAEYAQSLEHRLVSYARKLDLASWSQIDEKMTKMIIDMRQMTTQRETLFHALVALLAQTNPDVIYDGCYGYRLQGGWTLIPLKDLASILKNLSLAYPLCVWDETGSFVLVGTDIVSAKTLAQTWGVRGGGSDRCIQGKDQRIVALMTS
ncbi:MAG: hypothetical protein NZL83_01760 [Candidatus Absconditabacterales bacterium]|nr:hypothetical protein [Candidatus Absconditabacterales bacterium]